MSEHTPTTAEENTMPETRYYLWSDEHMEPLTNVVGELMTWPTEADALVVVAHYPDLRFRACETDQRGVDPTPGLEDGKYPLVHKVES